MRTSSVVKSLLLAAVLAASTAAGTALAQVNLNINLAPPAPQHEVVPTLAPGYSWAPGYWAWNGDRYIWIRGRQIISRPGHRWEGDRWDHRNGHYYRHAGGWVRDGGPPRGHAHGHYKVKKAKKHGWHGDKHGHGGKGHGHGGKGKGHGKHG